MDVIEKLFNDLESNNPESTDEAKKKLADLLHKNKDAGVVQGMTDYYAKTDSKRIVEILMKVQPPHDRFIFDRLAEWFRGQNKVLALDLFGHIVRKHPTWLYKVAAHQFMKDVLKLLKTEKDIIPLMNALLCIVMLLPIIPKQMTAFLQDLFDIFSHLAAWKCHNTIKLSEDQLLQLQLGLYKLFHRLYGMFPNNFMTHIRHEFVEKNTAVFTHTIRPLLESVKMHPSLLIHGTLDEERNTDRWNKMQPHDIVTECAKFSIDYCETNQDSHIDCRLTPDRSGGGLQCCADAPSSFVVNSSTVDFTPRSIENQLKTLHYSNLSSTPLYLLPSYIDKSATFFSPSDVIMATPPPTHTPTPTQILTAASNYSLQTIAGATVPLGGTSPPEAGIEATPETTPMKDIVNPVRPHPVNPKTVRAMWNTSSQPSSPLKKDPNAFRYTDIGAVEAATSSKFARMVSDREQLNMFLESTPTLVTTSSLATSSNPQSKDVAALLKQQPTLLQFSPNPSVDSTQEDQEVTEINRSNSNNGLSENDEECDDDYDDDDDDDGDDDDVTSDTTVTGRRSRKIVGRPFNSEAHVGSPCSAGGLHIPDSRTINNFNKRLRLYSTGYDVDSSFSCGASPSDVSYFDKAQAIRTLGRTKEKVSPLSKTTLRKKDKLNKSWPSLVSTSKGIFVNKQTSFDKNGIDSPPSTTASAAKQLQTDRGKIGEHTKKITVQQCHTASQTIDACSQGHEKMLYSLYQEEMLLKTPQTNLTPKQQQLQPPPFTVQSPDVMLAQYIALCAKKKTTEGKKIEDMHSEHIQLLNLELQFERHRREVHADRNRRFLGISRTMAQIASKNETLTDQVGRLTTEISQLNYHSNCSRRKFNTKEEEFIKELNDCKRKYNSEMDENKKLHGTVETLQARLEEETKNRKDTSLEIERLRAELLDLRNDYHQAQIQAELGQQYRIDMIRLQHEMIVMGEIQVKCKEKLNELNSYEARDMQMEVLQTAYLEELKGLKSTLEYKISQLETVKSQQVELEIQLKKSDAMFMEQKRLLNAVKEEYEEKFIALESKYEAQKAIGIKMEEHILEIYRNQTTAVNPTVSPESDKTDMAGSLDHTSPLSLSVTSSEGLSASLRSVPEIKNLQALVQQSMNVNSSIINSNSNNSNIPSTSINFEQK